MHAALDSLSCLYGQLVSFLRDYARNTVEFETIMDRVEEVFLGNKAKADEFTAVHIAENPGPMHRCPRCGNTDPAFFRVDARNGDTICIGLNGEGCGEVVQDHNVISRLAGAYVAVVIR